MPSAKKAGKTLPPSYPFTCDADFIGREVVMRECVDLAPSKGGKPRRACSYRKVTAVACATPSADKPKRPQAVVVASGQRYLPSTKEVSRDMRAAERFRASRGTKENGTDPAPGLAQTHPHPDLFSGNAAACVREMGGRFFVLNDRAKGWKAMGYSFASAAEIERAFPVHLIPGGQDAVGPYWGLADGPRPRGLPPSGPGRRTKENPLVDCKRTNDDYNRYPGASVHIAGKDFAIRGCDANTGFWNALAEGAKKPTLLDKRKVRDRAFQSKASVVLPDGRKGAKKRPKAKPAKAAARPSKPAKPAKPKGATRRGGK